MSGSVAKATRGGSILHEIAYIWQLYLPRLPGMTAYFPGISTTRQLWFDGLVGLYGWADTVFPGWVYGVALVPAGLLALLCMRALVLARAAFGGRGLELLVYMLMTVGLLALVGVGSYANGSTTGPFSEPRYLLPLLPSLGAALALAARGAGRRWGPALGVRDRRPGSSRTTSSASCSSSPAISAERFVRSVDARKRSALVFGWFRIDDMSAGDAERATRPGGGA